MKITIYHYETSDSVDYYDKDEFLDVHSVDIDLTNGKKISFIDNKGNPHNIEFKHPIYIELS